MVAVVVFEFGVMRCQPLRRALEKRGNNVHSNSCFSPIRYRFY
ncbi:acetyltransferase [Vibrio cholerae]|nr:acetyltransferase [Vibrio cholerae]EJP3280949.1 acetyltransferase [Vibrio cholerae]EKF9147176.1 acetyltransferase [Vibrio cholerae]EKF9376954.1 acetyltransferase [Vibrio cholerae]EKF9778736.1 acetyltransferase [Vibrio cholerae]